VRILFIGDIVGEPGRRAVKQLVPGIRQRDGIDLVIANGENSAGGSGITAKIAGELYSMGVDVITTGDHVWDQKEVNELLRTDRRIIRPLNYPYGVVGKGSTVWQSASGVKVGVLNVQGRVFMPDLENPFICMEGEVDRLRLETPILFVDIHAEATSEKIAMGRMLDGKVSAVVGTHTHVQTADEQIFPGGTAYLTDAGFTGPHDSVIGRKIEPVIRRFLHNTPQRFEVASGRILLQGVRVDVDEETGKATAIARVSESLPEELSSAPKN
jgi:metallophosphoesterase (TIGR00282 family)